jgi:hypothetical protein
MFYWGMSWKTHHLGYRRVEILTSTLRLRKNGLWGYNKDEINDIESYDILKALSYKNKRPIRQVCVARTYEEGIS